MLRRQFLQLGTAAALVAQQKRIQQDSIVAGATEDTSPRVGIVLSSFRGGEDHDGTRVDGLPQPCPADTNLTDAQLEAMVRKAIDLGTTRKGGLPAIIAPEDWVVIKPDISRCFGLGSATQDGGARSAYLPGAVTDLRIVSTVIAFLAENKLGSRITIAEGPGEWLPRERSKSETDGWSSDWGGACGGQSYRSIIDTCARRYPAVKFDSVDLNFNGAIELPAPAKVVARRNSQGTYHVPKTIQQCDKLISIAPLKTHPRMGVSLSIGNYLGIAPGTKYGFPKTGLDSLGDPDEVVVDLFGYHPADYAVLGGGWGLYDEKPVHHNLVIAGVNAVAVDAVGAAVMGFEPANIRHLKLARQMGYGSYDLDTIWMRGDEIESARRRPKKG